MCVPMSRVCPLCTYHIRVVLLMTYSLRCPDCSVSSSPLSGRAVRLISCGQWYHSGAHHGWVQSVSWSVACFACLHTRRCLDPCIQVISFPPTMLCLCCVQQSRRTSRYSVSAERSAMGPLHRQATALAGQDSGRGQRCALSLVSFCSRL